MTLFVEILDDFNDFFGMCFFQKKIDNVSQGEVTLLVGRENKNTHFNDEG